MKCLEVKADKLNKRPFEGIDVDLRVILKCTLNKIRRCGLDLYKSRKTPGIRSCELGHERFGPWKTGNILANWKKIQLLKRSVNLTREGSLEDFWTGLCEKKEIPFACSFMFCVQIIIVLFCVLWLCCSVYCLCVNVYCTIVTGCQPNCS